MPEGFDSPHLPYDVLTDVRFWHQIIRDSKRTIFCSPELAERIQERVCTEGLEAFFEVMPSQVCPEGKILIADTQAMQADFNEAVQRGPLFPGGAR